MQIRDRTTDANDAVRTVRYVRSQAVSRSKEVGADSAQYAQLERVTFSTIARIIRLCWRSSTVPHQS